MSRKRSAAGRIELGAVLVAAVALVVAAFAVEIWFTGTSSSSGADQTTGGASATLSVQLAELTITPNELQASAGVPLTVQVRNAGQVQHTFGVEVAAGNIVDTGLIDPGAGATLKLPALDPGTYQAYCSVPGHRDAGMTATITVGSGGATAATSGGNPNGMAMGSGNMPMGSASTAAGAGGTSASAGSDGMDGMTAEQMAEAHKASMEAFPAKTTGLGGQVLAPTMDHGVKVFHLTAQAVRWETAPGTFVDAFAYNGQIPGPQLDVQRGDQVRIELKNELPQPTVIHWHGLTVPNAMDGVPYITQDPVMPNQTFTYHFTVKNAPGTYLYHSHFNSAEQVGRGLFGAFVVEPDGKPAWDKEYTEIISDGPLGYSIDGKGWPATAPLTAKLGQTILIRLANMGSLLHPMHLHGYHFRVINQDGAPLQTPYQADTLVVAPGETYDVLVHTDHPGVWAFHCHILSHVEGPQGMFGMATALIVK